MTRTSYHIRTRHLYRSLVPSLGPEFQAIACIQGVLDVTLAQTLGFNLKVNDVRMSFSRPLTRYTDAP
ncbi:hypothetical protein HGRIS_012152 [Hohenbuehelia grisea]|uniref:Uncharacterized protein n=1 Tax=Hohenbuehelia grisea TaxID=104357 RepID=A0ABR3IRF5_9AGAR